tara:strand:- start:5227 stop:7920 length:2694 start_codon:yes stop_codon:yes gene_type:complete
LSCANFNTSFLLILLTTGFFSGYAQEQSLEGKVLDTLQQPLEYANVLAIPASQELNIQFSITDEIGNYRLALQKDSLYTIEINYLGYQKISEPVTLAKDATKNFILQPSNQTLDEVLIEQRLPVKVREDTITYRTDVFVTGEERKLREVLKKLPGVEVDRDGNVTVNGKKVDKLMVEGKTFFTGDTKLGVNNIPADAVDEVEVLDNYNEIAFLKGLSDSDKMAMNIKLKEGEKRFVFGDIEAGGGIEDRYLLHPSLFYYSPKTNVNIIGDFNNTGQKAFTFNDYINFEGGFTKLVEDPTRYASIANSAFARSLLNQDFVFNRNNFGAFNIAQQLGSNTQLTAYTIVNGSTVETREENINTYLSNNQVTNVENRTTTTNNDTFFTLSKVTLKHTPTFEEDLTYEAVVKTAHGSAFEQLQSISTLENNRVTSRQDPSSYSIGQNLAFNKQFSYEHTTTASVNFDIGQDNNNTDWRFTQPVFSNLIPLQDDAPFNIEQQVASKNYAGNLGLKHYWVLNNFNHIYPVLGYSHSHQEYSTTDFQLIGNTPNGFGSNGFNNATIFKLNDPYIGFQYKAKIGDIIIKPGLVYHYYFWDVSQFETKEVSTEKAQLLPEALIRWDIKSSEKLNAKYSLRSRFNDASFFANRLRLQAFNSLYRGNEQLENSLAHQASLSYYKFSLLKGLYYNASINYTKQVRSIRNSTLIEGIDQVNTSIYTNLPEENFSIQASFSKKIKRFKFTLSGNTSLANYSRSINDMVIDYSSNYYSYTVKTETYFKDWPNLEIGLRQGFSNFSSENFENTFTQTDPYAILEYDFLNNFIFKADYTYNNYVNNRDNAKNTFQIGNASLYYNKEDSPWGFEIEANNMLDVSAKNRNSFNQFIVSDTQLFIQPRTVLFKVSYKL